MNLKRYLDCVEWTVTWHPPDAYQRCDVAKIATTLARWGGPEMDLTDAHVAGRVDVYRDSIRVLENATPYAAIQFLLRAARMTLAPRSPGDEATLNRLNREAEASW